MTAYSEWLDKRAEKRDEMLFSDVNTWLNKWERLDLPDYWVELVGIIEKHIERKKNLDNPGPL